MRTILPEKTETRLLSSSRVSASRTSYFREQIWLADWLPMFKSFSDATKLFWEQKRLHAA